MEILTNNLPCIFCLPLQVDLFILHPTLLSQSLTYNHYSSQTGILHLLVPSCVQPMRSPGDVEKGGEQAVIYSAGSLLDTQRGLAVSHDQSHSFLQGGLFHLCLQFQIPITTTFTLPWGGKSSKFFQDQYPFLFYLYNSFINKLF